MREIGSDHPVRVEATPDNPITLLNRGDTFYYGQTSAVSSTNNDGSVTNGNSITLRIPTWVRSASQSFVDDLSTTGTNLGSAATKLVGTTAGTVAAGDDARFSGAHKSGLYYVPNGIATSGGSFTLGQMYLWPFVVGKTWSVDRVGILVTSANSFVQRIGLYADQTDGTPGALLNDWGTVDGSTTTFSPITITKTFDPGVYWLASVMQGSVAGSVARCSLTELLGRFCFTGTPTAGVHNPFRRDSVTGVLPNPAGTFGSDIVNATVSVPPGPVFRTA